ncbi:MAG: hypothetical protein L6Q54_10155 [Leptospiraceae bacterium]|nr:hypothetical protein [Leptospiraceae bacterium]MCK6381590.1 hypothetical protein [Leptospiraceae bacterium]NUM40634.1 hypothetical protein [Leptospiraceae bacterium]
MNLPRFIFLSIAYFIFPVASYFSAWFVFSNSIVIWIVSICFYLIFLYIYFTQSKNIFHVESFENRNLILVFVVALILMMIAYPVRNLNLGDGILIVENIILESNLFGYQLTLDELFEALLHSYLYLQFSHIASDPRIVYRVTSTVAGIIFIFLVMRFFKKKKFNSMFSLIIFSSGGMLLFFGYPENYTLTTLVILFFINTSLQKISEEKKGLKLLILPTIIASIAILFHLVAGYLIFPLIYLWYIASKKSTFIKNAVISAIIGIVIILPLFIYFIFFSDTRVDMSQTHIAHPPFYPVKKMFSTKHISEILSNIMFTSLVPFFIFLELIFLRRSDLKFFKAYQEFTFLIVTLIGFFIHAFIFHPLLGYPSDWDIMSFYWLPFSFGAVYILQLADYKKLFFLVTLVGLSFAILFINAIELNKPILEKEIELYRSLSTINRFLLKNQAKIKSMNPEYKKFYFKTLYFLYKIEENLEKNNNKKLFSDLKGFQDELEANIKTMSPLWQKDYINRLTIFHSEYLELIKNK